MYDIFIGRIRGKGKVEIRIEHPNPTAIPNSILIGIGNKKAKFRTYLDNSLNNEDGRLLNYLARIHNAGIKHGSISLICTCKANRFHAETIREFLIDNEESLTMMLPYLFEDAGYKANNTEEQLEDQTNKPTLPKEDLDIIYNLIREDQAKNNI